MSFLNVSPLFWVSSIHVSFRGVYRYFQFNSHEVHMKEKSPFLAWCWCVVVVEVVQHPDQTTWNQVKGGGKSVPCTGFANSHLKFVALTKLEFPPGTSPTKTCYLSIFRSPIFPCNGGCLWWTMVDPDICHLGSKGIFSRLKVVT